MKWETRAHEVVDILHDGREGYLSHKLGALRARVPGGWLFLVSGHEATSPTFIPDPTWSWDWSKDQP